MKHLSTKLIIASMIGVQMLQGAGFARYNSIQDLGKDLSNQGIIIYDPLTVKYSETVMRDEMASVITRRTIKNLNGHTQLQQGCRYRDLIQADYAYRQDIKEGCSIGLLTKRARFSPRGRATQGDAVTMLARAINHDANIDKKSAYQILLNQQIIDQSFVGQDDHGFTRYWLYDMMYRMDMYANKLSLVSHTNTSMPGEYIYDANGFNPQAIKSTLGMWGKTSSNGRDNGNKTPTKVNNNGLDESLDGLFDELDGTTSTNPNTNKPAPIKAPVAVKGQAYSPVVQVRVYEHDEVFGIYTLVGMGSAVLISDTQAITNAHVAVSEDDKPYYIELCTTYDPELRPDCTTTAKVVRYNNTTTDLALLEYSGIANKKLATMGNAPTISDQVIVHGYPVNGQDTITISQGIISGRKGNDYKIDASINHGNSGGGAFDKSGKLVGIPSYGIGDMESIGYIIGVDTIQQFIDKKISSTPATTNKYSEFSNYIVSQQSAKSQGSISTSSYNLTLKPNLTHEYSIKNDAQGISMNVFGTADGTIKYMISTQRIIDGTINTQTKENIISHVVPWATDDYTTSEVVRNGYTWTKATSNKSKDRGVAYVTTIGNIAYTVFVNNKSDNKDQGSWIVENMTFKTPNLSAITTIMPEIVINSNNGLIPSLGFDINTFRPTWVLYSSTNKGHIHFDITQNELSADELQESNKALNDLYEEDSIDIYKNKVGQYLIITKDTSTDFSLSIVAARNQYNNKQRSLVMVLAYESSEYPLYKQLVPWLETISLGGTNVIDKTTLTTLPSDYFEHKDTK